VETLINIVIVAFGLLCSVAAALFGRGERGTISSRVRRVKFFLAGLLVTIIGILRFLYTIIQAD
jgi:hypothetical protein